MGLSIGLVNLQKEMRQADRNFANEFDEDMTLNERGHFLNIRLQIHDMQVFLQRMWEELVIDKDKN